MIWREVKPLIFKERGSSYDFGCVMLYFTFYDLHTMQSYISPSHLYILQNDKDMFGLESKPHTTLLYGLHDNVDITDVANKLDNIEYSACEVTNLSLFENKYDVLKYDVSGSNLHESNTLLKQLPNTNEYPIYQPHLTIAYLKSGFGDRYVKRLGKFNYTLKPSHLVYTTPNGKEYEIDIKVKENGNRKSI